MGETTNLSYYKPFKVEALEGDERKKKVSVAVLSEILIFWCRIMNRHQRS